MPNFNQTLLRYKEKHLKPVSNVRQLIFIWYSSNINYPSANIHPAHNYNANPTTNSASFKYKNSITGKTLNNDDDNDENDNRKKGLKL